MRRRSVNEILSFLIANFISVFYVLLHNSLAQLRFQHAEVLVQIVFGVGWTVSVNSSRHSTDTIDFAQTSGTGDSESWAYEGEESHNQH